MYSYYLKKLKEKGPLIHNITNYVTVNDCANIIIACGGSPIMADDINEVEDITSICGGININIGTLNEFTIKSMLKAGKKANELNHPILLDPVGCGASKLRTDTAKKLLKDLKISVIRGNISEIKSLAGGSETTNGVDANIADAISEENLKPIAEFAKKFSKEVGAIIAITGSIDIVANENIAYIIRNGCPMMANITGSGCMLSAMTTAYITANNNSIEAMTEATVTSICAMGIAGEKAYVKMVKNEAGNSSYRNYLIDAIYNLKENDIEERAHVEKY